MKAAAVAVGVAAAFLAAVLWGVGQPQATRARTPSSIELRQANPAAPSSPPPRSATPAQKVHRTVGDRRLGDFDDRRGRNRGKDNSGPGGGGGSGDDGSGG